MLLGYRKNGRTCGYLRLGKSFQATGKQKRHEVKSQSGKAVSVLLIDSDEVKSDKIAITKRSTTAIDIIIIRIRIRTNKTAHTNCRRDEESLYSIETGCNLPQRSCPSQ